MSQLHNYYRCNELGFLTRPLFELLRDHYDRVRPHPCACSGGTVTLLPVEGFCCLTFIICLRAGLRLCSACARLGVVAYFTDCMYMGLVTCTFYKIFYFFVPCGLFFLYSLVGNLGIYWLLLDLRV